jgi:catalase
LASAYRERPRTISDSVDRHNHCLDEAYYSQPGQRFRLTTPDTREHLIGNIVASMKSVPRRIQELQTRHFCKADSAHGISQGPGPGTSKKSLRR